MRTRFVLLTLFIVCFVSGCSLDVYQNSKYGKLAVNAWFSDKYLGEVRKQVESIDEIVSTECTFLENKSNKYVFECKIVYKEKGETVIPLSKNSSMKVYAVFIKKANDKYDYKVYNSSSSNGVWKDDIYLNY